MNETQFRFVAHVFQHVTETCEKLAGIGKLDEEGQGHLALFQQNAEVFTVMAHRVAEEGAEHAERIFSEDYKGPGPEVLFAFRQKYLDLWHDHLVETFEGR